VLLGGYAAKSCARATHNTYDQTVPNQPIHIPDDLQALFDLGNDHEATVFDTWLATGADVVDLRELDGNKHAHIQATLQALQDGRSVVLGGRLPDDPGGGRTGKPDVLLREALGPGYHPGDIKAHLVLNKKTTGGLVADTVNPSLAAATTHDLGLRYDPRDLLQLCHYWRMLQACGHQAGTPFGAILGTDPGPNPLLAWYDLTEELFTTFSRCNGKTTRSGLQRYDHEHDFRIRVAQTAQRRCGAPRDPEPLVQAIGQDECLTCSWAPVCVDLLPAGDLSRELRGTLSVREYQALRQQGVSTVDDLASADIDALLDSPYADETSQQHGRDRRLRKAHVSAQLARDGVVLRIKHCAVFDVPRGDVEIDLDMECTREQRVYLWGVLVTEHGISTYTHFSDPTVQDDAAEHAVAKRCFDWLVANHPSGLVYHYAHIEKSHAARILGTAIASYAGTVSDPSSWIDLLPTTRACLESRDGLGLKVVATEGAGFHWRDEDPGGQQSQNWLDAARIGHAQSWQRILNYNEDDVRATLAVRTWLNRANEAPK
jgi:hypothetical protein